MVKLKLKLKKYSNKEFVFNITSKLNEFCSDKIKIKCNNGVFIEIL